MSGPGARYAFEVFRYGDLGTAGAGPRYGLTAQQLASLRSHPYARPEDPAGVLLVEDGHPCGRYGLIPGRMRVGGGEHRVFWSSDWRVDRPGPSAGALLVAAMREAGRLCVGGPSASAGLLYRAARFDLLPLVRMVVLLRSRYLLRRRLPAALARALAVPVDPLLRLSRRRAGEAPGAPSSGTILERRDRFDDVVSDVDRAANEKCCFPRDADELNWVMEHPWITDPTYRYDAWCLRAAAGRPIGYAMTRVRQVAGRRVGSIMRVGVDPAAGRAAADLIRGLVVELDRAGVDLVELYSSKRPVLEAARMAGLTPRGALTIACRFDGLVVDELRDLGLDIHAFAADMGEGDVIFT